MIYEPVISDGSRFFICLTLLLVWKLPLLAYGNNFLRCLKRDFDEKYVALRRISEKSLSDGMLPTCFIFPLSIFCAAFFGIKVNG